MHVQSQGALRCLVALIVKRATVAGMILCIAACCGTRDKKSISGHMLQDGTQSTTKGEMASEPMVSAAAPQTAEPPVLSASSERTLVDQTPALRRCHARIQAATSQNGSKVGSFCKQGGCRVIETAAKLYEQLLWCGKDREGVWGVTMGATTLASKKNEEDGPEDVKLTGALLVVRFTTGADGLVTEVEAPAGEGLDYSVDWFSTLTYKHQVSDLDDDGVPELVVTRGLYVEESPENNSTSVSAYRAHGGVIEPMREISGMHAFAAVDADRDGRLDLVLHSPFATSYPCISECTFSGPDLLVHTLEGGRFDRTDDVAIEFVRRQCALPHETNPPLDEWYMIACDRVRGRRCLNDGQPASREYKGEERDWRSGPPRGRYSTLGTCESAVHHGALETQTCALCEPIAHRPSPIAHRRRHSSLSKH